ncbi:MAG: mechanosensitive ion channel [Alphaproteobacteria bacterium]|nr:mechanosensitive ion channel [Alphaproteobacteria bacterium]
MADSFSRETLEKLISDLARWVSGEVLVWGTFYQLLAVLIALALASAIIPLLRNGLSRLSSWFDGKDTTARVLVEIQSHALLIVWLIILWIFQILAEGTAWGGDLIGIAVSLLAAWVIIQLLSLVIKNRGGARLAALAIWSVAALNILDLLAPTVELLDAAAVNLGGFRLSLIVVIKGLILFAVLLWGALVVARVVEHRLVASEVLSPSLRVLTNQLTKITLVVIAVVIALASVGIDLTAFAVFTGALGVGVGFGLQKVVANLISGILLLLDRSIKPGDVIAVSGTYGWVNFMGARYLSLITRDGTEHLIPNESLITNPVENWSYSNELLRLKVPLGISYKSDLHKAIALVREAASEVERVLPEPNTVCLVKGFGDSSVDLEARFWINDPRNGVGNVKSQVLLRIWDKFHENDIEIPFPQRDLHLKSGFDDTMLGDKN